MNFFGSEFLQMNSNWTYRGVPFGVGEFPNSFIHLTTTVGVGDSVTQGVGFGLGNLLDSAFDLLLSPVDEMSLICRVTGLVVSIPLRPQLRSLLYKKTRLTS